MAKDIELQSRRIRESREQLGLTQRDVSEKSAISQSAICRIENGSKEASSPELAAISFATGASIGFLTGEGELFSNPKVAARAMEGADVASATAQLLHLMEMDAEFDDSTEFQF